MEGGKFDLFERSHFAVYYGLRDRFGAFKRVVQSTYTFDKSYVSAISINSKTDQGATALIVASENGHDSVIELLPSQAGIEINVEDEDGFTALFLRK